MKRIMSIGLCVLGTVVCWGWSIVEPVRAERALPLAAWEAFQRQYGDGFEVVWDRELGTPRMIRGGAIPLGREAARDEVTVEKAARRFLAAHQALFKAEVRNLHLRYVYHILGGDEDRPGQWHVNYSQTYNGVEILGSRVGVIIDDEGNMVFAASGFDTEVDVSTTPAVWGEAAVETAAQRALAYGPMT